MSLFMSDSLKERVNLSDLEIDKSPIKIDTDFYCLIKVNGGSFYTHLEKFINDKNQSKKIVLNSERIKSDILEKIMDIEKIQEASIYLTGVESDFCIFKSDETMRLSIESIERASLSGYNYLITIFIDETLVRSELNV